MIVPSIPNSWFGTNSENVRTRKPRESIIVVLIIACPDVSRVLTNALSVSLLLFVNSYLKRERK